MMTDNLIHEEVTRAAKTLFSKRNRTLLHWLNPDISKNQIKIDVNAAWESLPAPEKVFYISQVLGKFAPHTTSLMVNPQLEPANNITIKTEKNDIHTDSGCSIEIPKIKRKISEAKVKKPQIKSKKTSTPQKRRADFNSDDDGSCDSGLVMDTETSFQPPEEERRPVEPRVKRKYTKRKQKNNIGEVKSEAECSSTSCLFPVAISNIKVEPNMEIADTEIPKVKRKYIKRKLVRKKYKKREPKNKQMNDISQDMVTSSVPEPQIKEEVSNDVDIWIEIDNTSLSKEIEGFNLLNDEVDNFWDSIDDPNTLFLDLEIE